MAICADIWACAQILPACMHMGGYDMRWEGNKG